MLSTGKYLHTVKVAGHGRVFLLALYVPCVGLGINHNSLITVPVPIPLFQYQFLNDTFFDTNSNKKKMALHTLMYKS